MAKMLKIESCSQCRFCVWKTYDEYGYRDASGLHCGAMAAKHQGVKWSIGFGPAPDWCPLPDADKET
jgi:hypothetical protein